MESQFRIPLDQLPKDPIKRDRLLCDYFDGFLPVSKSVGTEWEISLVRPYDASFFIDPLLEKGLEWWGVFDFKDIHLTHRSSCGIEVSLNDCWALYSWSKWIQASKKGDSLNGGLTIIHVDDHTDLMSPLLSASKYGFKDMLTKMPFDLRKPKSVQNAIESGSIGVGNFIVPLLHFVEKLNFIHLRPKHSTRITNSKKMILKNLVEDTLLSSKAKRPEVLLSENDFSLNENLIGTYISTDDPTSLHQLIQDSPIFLHIDMDYFNNRFDGDSDWDKKRGRFDPAESCMWESLDELTKLVLAPRISKMIENITIGISPGFFPAEYWEAFTDELEQRLVGIV